MGQVFVWEAIQSNKIPKSESFCVVADNLRKRLRAERSVVCALLCGSVVRGDFTIRSDIDCVVVYDNAREQEAIAAMHHMGKKAAIMHVPINFIPCDTTLSNTRFHHLGPSFIRHLEASIDAGGLIKSDLVDILAPTISAVEEIESYIRTKMYNMQESLAQMISFSEERLTSFLKKGLEAPTHVARKMLTIEGRLQGDSKREVQDRYSEVMPREMAELLEELLSLDLWYSSQLELQMNNPDPQRYNEVLECLAAEMPKVLQFLRLNILRLNQATR